MKKKVQILMIHGGMTFKNKADYLRFLKTRQISIEKKIKMKNLNLKSDKYRKSRGGYSRFLDIYCDHCGKKVFIYQKDGLGELKRLYLDRIISDKPIKSNSSLECPHCGR